MTEQVEVKLNLYQKIIEIRKGIDVFKKDTEGYGYDYVSGAQVLKKIKGMMDELQVLLIPGLPNDVHHETFDYTVWDKNSKQEKAKTDFVISGNMTYTWLNAENPSETLVVPWKVFGQQDDISKAFGSGLTYSERYFLLKFFGVPTDEADPDAKNTTGKKGKSSGGKLASEKQLNLINGLLARKVSEKYSQPQLYQLLKQQMNTTKDMEAWTIQDASKAIEILQNGNKGA